MRPQWQIISDGKKAGSYNMEEDLHIYKEAKTPRVRIYGWDKPCISLGYSQNIDEEIDLELAGKNGIEIIKRPTGGGIAFHTTDDIAYSVVAPIEMLPKGLGPSYLFISEIIVSALKKTGIDCGIEHIKRENLGKNRASLCFSTVMPHEITYNGKKLVGSAQKRGRHYLLQQGAISVSRPDEALFSVVRNKDEVRSMLNLSAFANEIMEEQNIFELICKKLAEEFENI